jgi:ribonuclease P protein component
MLPQASRLKKNNDFVRILGLNNKSKFGPLLVFTDDGAEPARFGFVVSKKISKKAVERNHLKRVLAEVVRTSDLAQKATGDWVAMALFKPENPYREFTQAIELWQKKLS